jgi:hypothetical protein
MESLPHRFRNQQEDIWAEPADIGSNVASSIERFKRSVVLDLFLQRGVAWKEVRAIRERWAITPIVRVPPETWLNLHFPENGWPNRYDAEGKQASAWGKLASEWNIELHTLVKRLVPERYRPDPIDQTGWAIFLSACVLFDPPETERGLLRFAERGGPRPIGLSPADERRSSFGNPPYAMLAAPIRWLRDGYISEGVEHWFWMQVIEEIGKKFLEPAGLDIHEMMQEVLKTSPALLKQHQDLHEQKAPARPYIAVDEETTEGDVRGAFRLISSTFPERSEKGAPQRDELVALQCALLYDRHNAKDPEDRRRLRWSYERLAEEFGLGSGETQKAKKQVAADYVALGRKLLEADQDKTTT